MFNKTIFLVLALSLTVAGCTTLKKVTGQTNDTVLPGPREDILPPDQQTARDPNITGGQPMTGNGVQQQPLVQPGMPESPQTAQSGNPLPSHQGTVVTCDPLVETCPGMEQSSAPKMAAKAKTPAGKAITSASKGAKPMAVKAKTDTSVETVGTDPMKPEATPPKKKKKKQLVLKPKEAVPAAPDATAPVDTQAPAPGAPPAVPPQ
jgi:hypothetical protein